MAFVSPDPRTLFDCADLLGPEVTASNLEMLINEGKGTFTTHLATFTRLAHSRRPGTRTMAKVLASRPAWRTAMQSDLEARVLAEIARQGLPTPEVQYYVRLAKGQVVRLDFAWPQLRVCLEVDHPFWHASWEESHRDKNRDRKLGAMGWRTPRLTSLDVDTGLRQSITEVGMILALAAAAA